MGVTIEDQEFAECLDRLIAESDAKPKVGDVLDRELRKLHGRPQQEAYDRLGYPDRKLQVAPRIVYMWERIEPDDLRCTVKVIAQGGRVVDTDFNGSTGACDYFAQRIDPTFPGLG